MSDRANLSRLLSEVFEGSKEQLAGTLCGSAWTAGLAHKLAEGDESYFADYELVAQLVLAGALRTQNADIIEDLFKTTLPVALGEHSPRAAKLCCWMITAIAGARPIEWKDTEQDGETEPDPRNLNAGQDRLPLANYEVVCDLFSALYRRSPEQLVQLLESFDWLASADLAERDSREQSLLCSCLTSAYIRVANYEALIALFRQLLMKSWERSQPQNDRGLLASLRAMSSECLKQLALQGELEAPSEDDHGV